MPSPADVLRRGGVAGDEALARREPRLPGLLMVLDPDALLDCLDALLPAGAARPTAARVEYVRYKPGTSIVTGVRLETPGGIQWAFAKAVGPDSPKLAKARMRAVATDAGWDVLVHPALRLAIGTAASDRRLRRAAALAAGPNSGVLRYKPERRLVARGMHGGRPALLKAHPPAAAAGAAAAHQAVAATGAPVPELLTFDARRGLVVCEWVPGTSLSALTDRDTDAEAQAGISLARLHRAAAHGLPSGPPVGRELRAAADAVGAVAPSLGPRAAALAHRLAGRLDASAGTPVAVHGDWSADQAVRRARDVVLVDLDRARRDDPAVDVAAWVAAEHAAGRAPDQAEPEEVAAALLAGHAHGGGPPVRGRLRVLTAAALLRRAVEPFRTRHPEWPAEVERLLQAAEAAC